VGDDGGLDRLNCSDVWGSPIVGRQTTTVE
jgi:hypothetical protein